MKDEKTPQKWSEPELILYQLGTAFLLTFAFIFVGNWWMGYTSGHIYGTTAYSCFIALGCFFIGIGGMFSFQRERRIIFAIVNLFVYSIVLLAFAHPLRDGIIPYSICALLCAVTGAAYIAIQDGFFPTKKKDGSAPSVDEISNRFAISAIAMSILIGIFLGFTAFLYYTPTKENENFFGGVDFTKVVLAAAGLATFFWAAKAAKNKSVELEERKHDGMRHDEELRLAHIRDTAQLVANAAKLLGGQSDAEKFTGLAFLYSVANNTVSPFQQQAFDLLQDYVLNADDIRPLNKTRMRAIRYLDSLCQRFKIHTKQIIIKGDGPDGGMCLDEDEFYPFATVFYEDCKFIYVDFNFLQHEHQARNCVFYICNISLLLAVENCRFSQCKIYGLSKKMITQVDDVNEIPENKIEFNFCDFSECKHLEGVDAKDFHQCYYYNDMVPIDAIVKKYKIIKKRSAHHRKRFWPVGAR